ncbi:MAG TPA: hypothetical protein VGQ53_20805 [Chitinophagaceae bacterium]|jgi:hypothetical protein|nr:hypothetical protein [Chitinophagaceae bacterium]
MNALVIAVVAHSLFSFHGPGRRDKQNLPIDTTINHVLDGKLNEWPVEKIETDPATQFKYAIDNDKQNLYLVLTVANFREQMKIMHQGMDLYFDPKDKKKEGKGIEFPVRRDQSNDDLIMNYRNQGNENAGQESQEQRKSAMKTIRAEMALNLNSMKVFGFSEDKSEEQGLVMPGSANIAFSWDSTDAMNIEYKIPLSLFGTVSSLDQKGISIGWKVIGIQFSAHHADSAESSAGEEGRHRGGGYGGSGRHGGYGGHGNANSQQGAESMMKDQSFWAKYTFR